MTAEQAPAGINPSEPSIARIYDFWLGGKDNYEADRDEATRLERLMPELPLIARQNRSFLIRAVRLLSTEGVDQFLDLGAGLPTAENTHEVAQGINPSSRCVYVDNDPMAIVHGRALLANDGETAMVAADLRNPQAILDRPDVTALIDFDRPVAVLIVSVLHFIPGDTAYKIVRQVVDRLAPGSYLVLSHALKTSRTEAAANEYRAAKAEVRTRREIEAFFEGLELVEPGLVSLTEWRPGPSEKAPSEQPPSETLPFLCGVGRT
ncbi:SAM-dependent methyltransferase [Actinomadura sp. NPDC047616]|uniref:SAM-dependent methyltransferase n=1 Tax=Actinomadura sp. NPDC047616 TaxID=3155914 RepID=UPI0033F49387